MECAFWGVLDPSVPVNDACSPILTLPERKQIARYLGEAQDEIEQVCGYPLSPRWFTDELPYGFTVFAKQKKIIEPGVMATDNVAWARLSVTSPTRQPLGQSQRASWTRTRYVFTITGTDIEIDPSDIDNRRRDFSILTFRAADWLARPM